MVWLVLTVVISVIGAIGLFVFVGSGPGGEARFGGAATVILCVLAEIILTLACSFATLGTGQVGLVYNFAGKLTGVKTQPGVKLDKGTVDKLNGDIRGYIHADETRKSILSANGLADDATAQRDAVNLNNLDDWKEFHEAALK